MYQMTFEEIKAKIEACASVSITEIKEINTENVSVSAMEEKSTALTQENILYREKHRIRLKPFWKVRLSRIIERFLSCTGMTKLPVHS